jgi:ribonuclease P protein component
MKFTLGKGERLKSRKLIGRLFLEGHSVKAYPFKLIYLKVEHTSDFPVQAGFSVPKRRFKKAVERNRIRRLIKEAYRLEKQLVYQGVDASFIFMITFIG